MPPWLLTPFETMFVVFYAHAVPSRSLAMNFNLKLMRSGFVCSASIMFGYFMHTCVLSAPERLADVVLQRTETLEFITDSVSSNIIGHRCQALRNCTLQLCKTNALLQASCHWQRLLKRSASPDLVNAWDRERERNITSLPAT